MESRAGRVPDGEQEHGVLGGGPDHRVCLVVDVARRDPRLDSGQRDRVAAGVEAHRGGVSGVKIVVQHPVGGGVPLVVGVGGGRLFGGVRAQQVVERVSAGGVFGDQV
jgi:hypothetical protein